jgi:anti-sigma B factor antagonist
MSLAPKLLLLGAKWDPNALSHCGGDCGRPHASTQVNGTAVNQHRVFKSLENGLGVTVTRVAIPSSSNLKISVDQEGTNAVVRLNGRVDVDSSPDLRDRLRTLLSGPALPQTIIVDLAGVSYIETSGAATLIEALRIARHHHTNFRLQGLSGAVLRLFEVTGVLALFEPSGSGPKVS